jgi:hypothetical protein
MEWIELRGMWNKNLLRLDAKEVEEARRILEKYKLRVTDIASPLFKVDWPGAPLSKFSPKRDQFNADFTFEQQGEVLERSIALAKAFNTDRVRCFDFWRLDDRAPHRDAMNEKLLDAANTAGKERNYAGPGKRTILQHRHRRRIRKSSRCREIAAPDAELGCRQRRHARRKAVSRRLQSAAEGAHRPLPLQGRDRQSQRRASRLGRHGTRHHRLAGPVHRPQTRRLSSRRQPRNPLGRRRHPRKNPRAKAGPV